MMMRYFPHILLLMVFSVGVVYAQPEACEANLEMILSTVADNCDGLERNEACFGNPNIDSETLASDNEFVRVGDVIPVTELVSLQTYTPSEDDEEAWGIAVFSVLANLPDTISGQNVSVIVFGDAEVMPDAESGDETLGTMQAFYLRAGVGNASCRDVPEGGVLVQNPRGTTVNMMVNGFDLSIGSTVFLTAEDTDALTLATLDGNVEVTSDGVTQAVPAGFTLSVERDVPPALPEAAPEISVLPSVILPEAIPEIGEPTTEAFGLLQCAGAGGIIVDAGDTIILRGGWADFTLESVIDFAANTPPSLDIDGALLPYAFRAGPSPWSNADGDGFLINWYWQITEIEAGTTTATWVVGGETVLCDIRAN